MARIEYLGIRTWVAGVLILAFAVHPISDWLTAPLGRFREAVYGHTAAGSVVVIEWRNRKIVNPVYGERERFYFRNLTPDTLEQLLARHGTITVVLDDRSESRHLRERALENQKIIDALTGWAEFELLFEWGEETSERLRIWRVSPALADKSHRSLQPAPGMAFSWRRPEGSLAVMGRHRVRGPSRGRHSAQCQQSRAVTRDRIAGIASPSDPLCWRDGRRSRSKLVQARAKS